MVDLMYFVGGSAFIADKPVFSAAKRVRFAAKLVISAAKGARFADKLVISAAKGVRFADKILLILLIKQKELLRSLLNDVALHYYCFE
ncbi:hypothetical protein ACFVT8_19070 [Lysinibacillus sp. NPDC058147]|uniref:hypothetical protein n=1 Tax=unclassified Lysinibacillus TaxID=2636778 RepID=UPI0036D9AF18